MQSGWAAGRSQDKPVHTHTHLGEIKRGQLVRMPKNQEETDMDKSHKVRIQAWTVGIRGGNHNATPIQHLTEWN